MLEYPLFVAVTSADYYLSTKDIYQTFCFSLSYIFTSLIVADTIEYKVEVLENILC